MAFAEAKKVRYICHAAVAQLHALWHTTAWRSCCGEVRAPETLAKRVGALNACRPLQKRKEEQAKQRAAKDKEKRAAARARMAAVAAAPARADPNTLPQGNTPLPQVRRAELPEGCALLCSEYGPPHVLTAQP